MLPDLTRITRKASADPTCRFTALAHYLNEEFLLDTWLRLNRRGSAGIDRQTMQDFDSQREPAIRDLVDRSRRHAYQAPPVRRVYIPKPGQPAKMRPLGIPTVADRLMQAAVARILSAIYEPDFLESSYGFRPERSAHDALDAIESLVFKHPIHWVFEADIRGFFDHLDHQWLERMLSLRIGDPWILRLVGKWLRAPIDDQGTRTRPAEGTPQGGPASPILANVYLHYVLDLWFARVVQPRCHGEAHLVRFADDFVVLFEDARDAQWFARALPQRLAKFSLEVAEEKTRLLPFGRRVWAHTKSQPCTRETFDFLGFRHVMGTSRKGNFRLVRIPTPKSIRKFYVATKQWMQANRHAPPALQQQELTQRLRGFYQYFGYGTAIPMLTRVRKAIHRAWWQSLRRRSQRSPRAWTDWAVKPWFRLPSPRVTQRTGNLRVSVLGSRMR